MVHSRHAAARASFVPSAGLTGTARAPYGAGPRIMTENIFRLDSVLFVFPTAPDVS